MDQKPGDKDQFQSDTWRYESLDVTEASPSSEPSKKLPKKHRFSVHSLQRAAIILAGISLVLSIIIGAYVILKKPEKKPTTSVVINTQSLDNGTLNQLTAQADGSSKQQLTITPDTLFQNNVTISKNLLVKGQTTLQSSITITKELAVGSNLAIGGNLSVNGQISAGSLNVGSITIASLRLSGDLEFSGHILPTGATPTIKTDVAATGATTRIDGSDTAGTITITTDSHAHSAGMMVIVTFRAKFSGVPKVQLTPVSAAASKLDYFVTKSAGFFTIETTSAPAANSSYSFDYLITE